MRCGFKKSGQRLWRWRAALTMFLVMMTSTVVWATPSVTFTAPADGSQAVSAATSIQASFNEAMDSAGALDGRHITLNRKVKVVAVAAGDNHALALRNDGTVATWKYLGDYYEARDIIPAGLSGVAAVAAGHDHSLALKKDGTVVAWGKNDYGQINVPANLSGVVAIAAGSYHSVALKSDGTVVTWGNSTVVPSGLSGIKAIAARNSLTLALKSDGTVVAWGQNGSYSSYTGISGTIPAGLTGVAAIAQGYWHGLALKCDGTVVAWGNNSYGQSTVPAGLTGVQAIAAGQFFSMALKSDGTVVTWGKDRNGLLSVVPAGLNNVTAIAGGETFSLALKNDCTVAAWGGVSTAPENPPVPDEPSELVAVAQGGSFGMGLRRDGKIVTWGSNASGQDQVPTDPGFKAIAAGFYHGLALKNDGTVAAWGGNNYGQKNVPAGLSGVKGIAAGANHSLALKSDGTVVAWGDNTYHQRDVPASAVGVVAIASENNFSAALKSDGTVVAWGDNSSGQCNVPAGLSGVKAIAVGYNHMLALKNDGTIVGWGSSSLGITTAPADLNGVTVLDIAAGQSYSAVLKSDGTVESWGLLFPGSGTTMPAALTGVRSISGNWGNITALKSNNTVVAWGAGNYGQATVPYPYRNANIYETPVLGIASYDAGTNTAILTPLSPLDPGAYVAEAAALRNAAGAIMFAQPALWSFTTEGYDATTVCPCFTAPVYPTCPGGATYKVTATVAGNLGGSITCTPSQVSAGGNSVCTISANTGYQLTALTDNAGDVLAKVSNNSYTISAIQADHAVIATFADKTAPVLPVLPDLRLEATSPAGAVATFTVTATDSVDPNPRVVCTPPSGSTFPLGITAVICTATDASGNSASRGFTVTVVDTTAPVVTPPPNVTVEATGPLTRIASIGTATASDAVGVVSITSDAPANGMYPLDATLVTWTAKDAAGNAGTARQTITVTDTTAPVLTVPGTIVVEATSSLGAPVNFQVGAVDLVDPAPVVFCNYQPNAIFPLGETMVSCTAKDFKNNSTVKTFKIVVQDTTPPVIAVPADKVVEATGPLTKIDDIGQATATDFFLPITITNNAPGTKLYPVGTTTVTWTAKDANNNPASKDQHITVQDTTPPTLVAPADLVIEAKGPLTHITKEMIGTPVATDAVGVASVTSSFMDGDYPLGPITVTWTAKDAANNATTATQKITVVDTTPPNLTGPPANLVIEATSIDGAPAFFTVTATDLVDPAPAVSCTRASGSMFPLGITTVTCSAKDFSNNVSQSKSFTVTVVDTTPPVLTVPADKTVEATGPMTVVETGEASATDIFMPVTISNNAPADKLYAIGTTTVTWTAKDANGNPASANQHIKVQDTTAPVVTPPANITIEATGPLTHIKPAAVGTATATDAVGVTSMTGNFVEGDYPLGPITVVWTAKDAAGNVGTATQIINVVDTTAPALTAPSGPVVVEATSPGGAPVFFNVTATDLVDPAPGVTCSRASGSIFPIGDTAVTCSATDFSRNASAPKTFIVRVQDTTAPALILPANQVLEATSPAGAPATFTVTATDRADAAPAVTCSAASGSIFSFGTTTVTCTAKDASSNSTTGSFTITVRDTTPPALTVPKDITVVVKTALTAPAVQAFLKGATATDIASLPVTITATTPDLSTVGSKTVTFTATDSRGNSTTGSATIHVVYGCGDTYVDGDATNYLTPVELLKPFKLGSTIPVKLHLCDANGASMTSGTPQIFLQPFNNNQLTGDRIVVTSTSGAGTGNFFRVAGNMFIYNLYTKSLDLGTYQIQAVLDDGTTRTIPLVLK